MASERTPRAFGAVRLRDEALDWRKIEDEVIALEGRTATYLSANPAASLLWEALARGTTRDELRSMLIEEFGLDEERAGADVDAFLTELAQHDLLVEGRQP
jgi:hypothetical protein